MQTRLTQTKETEMKDKLTEKTSETMLLILHGGREPLSERASKQILKSPSMMILDQPSAEARLMAQRTAAASAWMGRHQTYFFAHILIGAPV